MRRDAPSLFAACVLAAQAGCEAEPLPRAVTRSGVIVHTDAKLNQAVLAFENAAGERIEFPGQADDATRITVNGRLARIDEVHVGDDAVITGYLNPTMTLVQATRVEITRAPPSASQPASAPASIQPADDER